MLSNKEMYRIHCSKCLKEPEPSNCIPCLNKIEQSQKNHAPDKVGGTDEDFEGLGNGFSGSEKSES